MNIPRVIGAIIFVLIMISIGRKVDKNMETKKQENNPYNQERMIENVQLAVYSEMKNWILFENGTYVVVEEEIMEERIRRIGITQMKQARGSKDDVITDFLVTKLPKVDGWSVNRNADGMYTYVYLTELGENPTQLQIAKLGKEKRDKDAENLKVICISADGEIIKSFNEN